MAEAWRTCIQHGNGLDMHLGHLDDWEPAWKSVRPSAGDRRIPMDRDLDMGPDRSLPGAARLHDPGVGAHLLRRPDVLVGPAQE